MPTQVVQIEGWLSDEDYPVFPVGSKPKRLLVCPHGVVEPFLIEGHKYLFKTASDWQAYQSWSEVIAYDIGNLLGLDVPPAFIAVDGKTGETGVLVEFFYGYPRDKSPPRLIHGGDILPRLHAATAYDSREGRPHTVRGNLAVCRALAIPDPSIWWGRAFAFDALIGNTDRHPDNWGFLVIQTTPDEIRYHMAPIFDNATSLGYEQTNTQLAEAWSDERISRYIEKGTHHCSWSLEDRHGMPHLELCTLFCEAYPLARPEMKHVVRIDDSEIEATLSWCTEFEVPVRFDAARAAFVATLMKARRNALAKSLGE
jgi:hypothetical protein